MKEVEKTRTDTAQAVAAAAAAWAQAPAHIRAVAGAYVGPLLACMLAMNEELQGIQDGND